MPDQRASKEGSGREGVGAHCLRNRITIMQNIWRSNRTWGHLKAFLGAWEDEHVTKNDEKEWLKHVEISGKAEGRRPRPISSYPYEITVSKVQYSAVPAVSRGASSRVCSTVPVKTEGHAGNSQIPDHWQEYRDKKAADQENQLSTDGGGQAASAKND